MSFGFGVGDFIAVGELCWKVYKKCKDSSGNYAQLASEVSSLQAVIKETQELLSEQSLSREQGARLLQLRQGCEEVLRDLEGSLAKYESLGTKTQRSWDRFKFGMEDMKDMRQRITLNITLLGAFVHSSSLARLNKKLDLYAAEVRAGKREGSIISTKSIDTVARNDQQMWEEIRRELEDVGISRETIVERRPFIITWLQEAIAAGKLEEEAPLNDSDSAIGSLESDDLCHESDELVHPDSEDSPAVHAQDTSALNQFIEVVKKTGHNPRPPPRPIHSGPIHAQNTSALKQSDEFVRKTSQDPRPPTSAIDSNPQQGKKKSGLRLSYLINRLKDTTGEFIEDTNRRFVEAVVTKDLTEAQKMLQKGADVNTRDLDGTHLLDAACRKNWDDSVLFLLGNGADTEAINHKGDTPLMIAACENYEKIARLLLKSGANVEARDGTGHTPLLRAAERNRENILRMLLEKGGSIEARNNEGSTPMILAAMLNHENIVRVLVEKGANIEARDRWPGKTPLICAASEGHDAMVRLLLERGASIRTRDKCTDQAFEWAERGGHPQIAKMLRDLEALPSTSRDAEAIPSPSSNSLLSTMLGYAKSLY